MTLSAGAAAATAVAAAGAAPARAAGRHDELPEVPGMHGDRWANEFWYELDRRSLYEPTQEVVDAYEAVAAQVGHEERGMREAWLAAVAEPDYPDNFVEVVRPIREPLTVLSELQIGLVDEFYAGRHLDLVRAFGWFGEGVLYDPRVPPPWRVHTMNTPPGEPPPGYHTWFAYMRAMMLLDIHAHRWERTAPALAFAWAVQSTAEPAQDEVNPPLPRRTVAELALTWLSKDVEELDREFRSFPLPEGMG